MRKKIASLNYFKLANLIDIEIKNEENFEIKKGKIMVASQLYFYCGETGLKYLLNLGNYSVSRENILLELKIIEENKFDINLIRQIEELYLDLLPKSVGGNGFRNKGAYQGQNSSIYLIHKKFAKLVIKLLK